MFWKKRNDEIIEEMMMKQRVREDQFPCLAIFTDTKFHGRDGRR